MSAWDDILKLDAPAAMFDMAIFGSYVAGGFRGPLPVDESRRVFAAITERLREQFAERSGARP